MKMRRLLVLLTSLILLSFALTSCTAVATATPSPSACADGYVYDEASSSCQTRVGACTSPQYFNATRGICMDRGGGCYAGYDFDVNGGGCRTQTGGCAYPQYYNAAAGACQDRGGGCVIGSIFDPNTGCRLPYTATPGGPGCFDGYAALDGGCRTTAGNCLYPQYYNSTRGICMDRGGGCYAGYYFDVDGGGCRTLLGDCRYPQYYNAGTGMCSDLGGGCVVGSTFDANGGCRSDASCPAGYCGSPFGVCQTGTGNCPYPSYFDTATGACRQRASACPDGSLFDANSGQCLPGASLVALNAVACGIPTATATLTLTPTMPVCPPGTYYSETTNKCIEIQILTPKPAKACSEYKSDTACKAAGCTWDSVNKKCK